MNPEEFDPNKTVEDFSISLEKNVESFIIEIENTQNLRELTDLLINKNCNKAAAAVEYAKNGLQELIKDGDKNIEAVLEGSEDLFKGDGLNILNNEKINTALRDKLIRLLKDEVESRLKNK